ncbi:polysaccharide biosynthesis/export family protein [Candidatus Parabeggiatoa sp. HSG14]|uniref:polysaccharide biosynthesis/export family protein n=1 Tax=Candidatus Parabeggiatoa sp. HSG14 TaxID=3055593 RepID=UPI0025A804CB|nr:polysaccharide biosynthesis/export family protein [Thiotrichales bacterium HSG14]
MNNHLKILMLVLFPILLSSCLSQALFDDPVSSDTSIAIRNKPQTQQHETPAVDNAQQSVKKRIPQTKSYGELQSIEPIPQEPQQSLEINTPLNLSNYRLNAGDLISIKVFGEEDFSVTTHLNETGTISYPFLGELNLADLTINQVEQLITSGLGKDYLVNPKLTVMVLEYQKIFVNGEVKNPGGYVFVPGLTVNKAISLAGGFTEKSSRDEISIIRSGKKKTGTPQSANLKTYMQPGDIIIVKEYQKFFVNGEVKKPGGYTFELGMTVEKAISVAGGFTEFGSIKWSKIFVLRAGDESIKAQPAKLRTPIYPGDIITIDESIF